MILISHLYLCAATTPWFETYREAFFQVFPVGDHECHRHYLACILRRLFFAVYCSLLLDSLVGGVVTKVVTALDVADITLTCFLVNHEKINGCKNEQKTLGNWKYAWTMSVSTFSCSHIWSSQLPGSNSIFSAYLSVIYFHPCRGSESTRFLMSLVNM